jgi:hypothetical protein
MKKAIVYDIRIRARSKRGISEVNLGIAENWDGLKTVLYSLLEVIRPDALDSIVITPLEVQIEEQEQA